MENLYAQIESLSLQEFEALLRFIDKTRKERAQAILAEAQKKVARLNPESELMGSKKQKRMVKPAKYRDPHNPDNTWSGYGRQPEWLKQYVADGGDKDDLLIV